MALVIADRVRETTTSTGTGTITLAGAYSGFQAFSVIGNGNTTYYAIIDAAAGAWEVGLGTYTSVGNTLSRDTVLSSSAGGSAVNFAAGVKDVIVTQPAGRAVYLDTATNTTVPGVTISSGTANGVAYLNGSKALTTGSALTFDGSSVVLNTSSASDALRITQTGAGNALVVEDNTNPDSTPFVVNTIGRIITGYTSALENYSAGGSLRTPQYQIQGASTSFATQSITNWALGTTGTGASYLILAKSRSDTVGTQGTLTAADQYIGVLQFNGDDGTDFIPSAWIRSATDGTPGTGDMPGRLEFATTADGSSTPTERLRIKSDGESWFQANNTTAAVTITQTGTGNALVVEDSANPDSSPLVVDAVGRLVVSADQSYQTVVGDSTTATPQVQQHGTSSTTSSVKGLYGWNSSNPYFVFSKAGAGGVGTYATVAGGNTLGVIQFNGADGTSFVGAAQILGAADGTPTAGNVPGRLVFNTCAAGGVLNERFRISNFGGWGLAGANYGTASTQAIVSNGNAAAPTWQDVVTPTATQTLTNKRVTPRVSTTTSSATPTINTDTTDVFGLTAQTVDITSFTTNLSGTPTDGQLLRIYIVGTAARAITWGASFEASTVPLPTTTVSTNRLDVGFIWNAATSKWRCVATA